MVSGNSTVRGPDSPAILFVDDDLANLKVLEVHLRSDFRVLTAQNGTDALALLEGGEHDIGLVVADQRMAGMTGVELLSLVRSRFSNVGRMLITAFADLDPVIAAINEGQISGYIRKPWNPADIRLLLRSGLERVVLERRLHQAEVELLGAERDAVIGFVGAGVGHELNQPTSVLRMNLDLLRDGMAEWSRPGPTADALEDARTALEDCLQAVEELVLLSADLRVIAASGQRTGEPHPVDLNAAVQRGLRFMDAHLRQQAELELALEEVAEVRADETGLTQVVVNILAHALQYLDASNGRRAVLSVSTAESDGHVVLSVRDNGPGIPTEELMRAFDPLVTDARGQPISRLGLAFARKVVEAWGGQLLLTSSADVGSAYEVRILPSRAKLSVVPAGDEEEGTRTSVLVVDDEPSVLRAVQRILRGRCDVDVVDNGQEALAKLESGNYGVVLCDVQMPRPDGAEVYDLVISKRPEMAGRFAFMTGGALSARAAAFLERVETDGLIVLNKPFDHRLVRRVVLELTSKPD